MGGADWAPVNLESFMQRRFVVGPYNDMRRLGLETSTLSEGTGSPQSLETQVFKQIKGLSANHSAQKGSSWSGPPHLLDSSDHECCLTIDESYAFSVKPFAGNAEKLFEVETWARPQVQCKDTSENQLFAEVYFVRIPDQSAGQPEEGEFLRYSVRVTRDPEKSTRLVRSCKRLTSDDDYDHLRRDEGPYSMLACLGYVSVWTDIAQAEHFKDVVQDPNEGWVLGDSVHATQHGYVYTDQDGVTIFIRPSLTKASRTLPQSAGPETTR